MKLELEIVNSGLRLPLEPGRVMTLPYFAVQLRATPERNRTCRRLLVGDAEVVTKGLASITHALPSSVDSSRVRVRVEYDRGDGEEFLVLLGTPMELDEQEVRCINDFGRSVREIWSTGDVITHADLAAELKIASSTKGTPTRAGRLNLLATLDLTTSETDSWHLYEIEEALPHLIQICRRPRVDLHVEEELRPVDLVRKTGPTALRRLASRSEDWAARTPTGLRPLRLVAETVDENIVTYSNRVVYTVLDRLTHHLRRVQRLIRGASAQNQNALDWDQYASALSDYRSLKLLDILNPSFDVDLATKKSKTYQRLADRVERISRQLTLCRNSRLAESLRLARAQLVRPPFMPTNILTMDPHYKRMVELWRQLGAPMQETETLGHLLQATGEDFYAFCFAALDASLRLSGFEGLSDDGPVAELDALGRMVPCGTYRRGDWYASVSRIEDTPPLLRLRFWRTRKETVRLPVAADGQCDFDISTPDRTGRLYTESGHLHIEGDPSGLWLRAREALSIPEATLKSKDHRVRKAAESVQQAWRQFIEEQQRAPRVEESVSIGLLPLSLGLGISELDQIRRSELVLDQCKAYARKHDLQCCLCLTPHSVRNVGQAMTFRQIRRLINHGDTFFAQDSERWGDVAGLLPISRYQLNSVQRLIRLVTRALMASDLRHATPPPECPLGCGRSLQVTKDRWHCLECKSTWQLTRCGKCQHPFSQFQFGKPPEPIDEDDYRVLLEKLETVGGGHNACGTCESSVEGAWAKPICPKCGSCAGNREMRASCLRCSSNNS